jgi:hypothetical protein
MAVRPVNPPAFDVASFDKPLQNAFPDAKGNPRPVYSGQHSAWKRWVNGDGEFDGKGLADAVKTNATDLNTTKNDVANARADIKELENRLAVLEAQPTVRPFP